MHNCITHYITLSNHNITYALDNFKYYSKRLKCKVGFQRNLKSGAPSALEPLNLVSKIKAGIGRYTSSDKLLAKPVNIRVF